MKYLPIILFVSFFFVACKKNTGQELPQNLLVGKWQVINDTSSVTRSSNGFLGTYNYKGNSTDYYDFTPNGNLYVREGQSFDTATYLLSTNNQQVEILYSYSRGTYISGDAAQPFSISDTMNHLTLALVTYGPSPEGYLYRVINLKR